MLRAAITTPARLAAAAIVAVLVAIATPAGAMAATTSAAPAATGARHALNGNKPPALPHGSQDTGALAGSSDLNLEFVLHPGDPAALAAFATAVNTPGNPAYHHFLAPGAFAKTYGASPAAVAQVRSYLSSQGLHAGDLEDGLSISFTATVDKASSMFATSFHGYRLASGRKAHANTTTPSLPAEVADSLQGVLGLSDVIVPTSAAAPATAAGDSTGSGSDPSTTVAEQDRARAKAAASAAKANSLPAAPQPTGDPKASPATLSAAPGPQPCSAASADATGYGAYTADQLAKAYKLDNLFQSGLTGAGQSVGLIELEPFLASDISAYKTCYGLTNTVTVENVDGGVGTTGAGVSEAALDIETVMTAAPGATLNVYSAPNGYGPDVYRQMAADDTSKVLTSSWGICEPINGVSSMAAVEATYFQQMASQGQDLYAAAGDSGSEGCERNDGTTRLAVMDPASQPFVTGIGGTSLTAVGPAPTEKVWNNAAPGGAGGGGISSLWSMPAYQAAPGVVNSYSSASPCAAVTNNSVTNCREVPDVSAVADPNDSYAIYYNGSWTAVGGTSAASPLWAGLMAVIGQSCPVGFVNPALYAIASSSTAAPAFNDVVTGNNDYQQLHNGSYPATAGADLATGLGTPIASGLQTDLCQQTPAPSGVVASPGNGQATVVFTPPAGSGTSYQVTAKDTTTPGNGGQTAAVSASPAVVTGLTNGDNYTFSVTATQGSSTSLPSGATAAITPATSLLGSGQGLSSGQALSSPGGAYQLVMQAGGNLVDRATASGKTVWSSGTSSGSAALMRADGSFVVRDSSNTVVFDSGTSPAPGAYLELDDDGQLQVQSVAGNALWSPALSASAPVGSYGATRTLIPAADRLPYSDVMDSAGNLYVVDMMHGHVLKVAPGASTSTVVPISSLGQPWGLAVDTHNNLFVSDIGLNHVVEYSLTSGQTTVLPFSGLNQPWAVTVDAGGDVYVADTWNDRVVELPAGSTTQVAVPFLDGTGNNLAGQPAGLAVDAAGDLFVSSSGGNAVYERTPGGSVSQLPFGFLYGPAGLLFDPAGDLYLADQGTGRVLELAPGATSPTTVASHLPQPAGLTMDPAGDLYVAEYAGNRVDELAAGTRALTTVPAFRGLASPNGIAADAAGDLFIADTMDARVLELPQGSSTFTTLYEDWTGAFEPVGVAVDRHGNVFVVDALAKTVNRLSAGKLTALPFTGLSGPGAIQVDRFGNVFVADASNPRVLELPAGSSTQQTLGFTGLVAPEGIALDNAGDVFVADYGSGNGRVLELANGAAAQTVLPFSTPSSVATDTAGDLFVSDGIYATNVRELPAGSGATVALPYTPPGWVTGMAVDVAGNLMTTDNASSSLVQLPFNAAHAPAAPTSVAATRGDGKATVSFTAGAANGSPITGYTVTASPGGVTATGSTSPITVSGLTNGTPYTFTVTATNAAGTSGPSTASTAVTPAGKPAPVTGVSAVAHDGSAFVSWSIPADNGSPITGFVITPSAGSPVTVADPTATGASVGGLSNGGSYTFTVQAVNAVGTGTASAASAPVTPAGKPLAPTSVVAAPGDGQASVSFTAGSANGSSIIGYTVTAAPGGATASGAASPITVPGLTNGTPYTFTVTATNGLGTGTASSPSSAVTPAAKPGQVTGVTAVGHDQSAFVSWVAPADTGGTPLTGFVVTPSTGSAVDVNDPNATSITVSSLSNGTQYTFTVAAKNSTGAGLASAPSAPVTPAGKPGAPTSVAGTLGDGSVSVAFTAGSANGATATGFTVTATPGGATASGASSPIVVSNLTNGTSYTFTVTATSPGGTSVPSTASQPVTPAGLPGRVTGVSASAADGTAFVTWTTPANNGSPITAFVITPSVGSPTTVSDPNATGATVSNLTDGNNYTFTVQAVNAVGKSVASDPSNTVKPIGKPLAPTGVTAEPGNGQATVSFTPGADNGSAISGYTVTAAPGGVTATGSGSPVVVTGLTNGTSYAFTVTATNGLGTGAASLPSAKVTPLGQPGQVTGVSAVAHDQSATVSWLKPADNGSPISGFIVTPSAGSPVTVDDSAATSTTVSSLTNGADYTFTVQAVNAIGNGPASAPTTPVTPAGKPLAPTGVTAQAGDGQASVSFTPGSDNGSSISSYTVTASPGGATGSGTSSPISVQGLADGTPYTFTVTATNAAGVGPSSLDSTAVTPTGKPAQVTSVAALAEDASAFVSWATPFDNGSPLTGYIVTPSVGSPVTVNDPDATGVMVNGLTNGSTYTFTVQAVNALGTGVASLASSPVTPAGKPLAPTGLSAQAGDAKATVSFTPGGDNGSPITGYTVMAWPGGISATGASSPITVTGLANGTPYTFTVTASNEFGSGAVASTATAVTPAGKPGQVTGVHAVAADRSALVSWVAPADNGGSPLTGYVVTPSVGSPVTVADPNATSVTVPGLTNGASYTFTVSAVSNAGTGLKSAASTAVTPAGKPSAPTGVTATRGDHQASVVFTAGSSNGSAITGYTVTAAPGGTTATATSSPITVTGLANGTSYTFTVTATNAVGTGLASAASTAVTPAGKPAQVTGVGAKAGDSSAAVSWLTPSSNGSPITGFVVTPSVGSPVTVTSPSATTATVAGLTNGAAYTFTVRAVNAVGSGLTSAASASVTPAGAPFAPTGVGAVGGNGKATVTFTAPQSNGSPIQHYAVTASPGGVTATGASSPITVSGLTNGTTYTFTVQAVNAVGTGLASAASNAVAADGTPPVVTVTSGPAAATNATQAVFAFTASDPGRPSAVLTLLCSIDADTPAPCSGSAPFGGLANGVHSFHVVAEDEAGNVSPAGTWTWRVDTVKPTVHATALPTLNLATKAAFSYAGSDGVGSGIARYAVRYRTAAPTTGLSSYVLGWPSTTASSVSLAQKPGVTYCFDVAVADKAGNASAWSADDCTARSADVTQLVASRGWTRLRSSSYYDGLATTTKTAKATLTLARAQVKRIDLVATSCRGCGTVGIYLGTTLLKKISLNATKTTSKRLFAVTVFASVRSGSVIVKNLGTTPVRIEGLAVSRV